MTKRLTSLLLIAILIGSCAPTPASSPPPVTATATQTVTPPETHLPAQTEIPTSTPYPSLQTDGPYLLYAIGWDKLTILDADSQERKQFQLPNNGLVRNLKKAVSPDGKWLAYFTGTSHKEPYDLSLHLFNLEDQTTFPITNLVADGFPENLESVKTSDPVELESCNHGPCRISIIELAFNEGIESIAWSPDSQSLAFAAQIDGPSSDVYIFSIQDNSVRRLVSDSENVWSIDWSPNGEKIIYQNSTAGLTYTSTYIYVADPHIDDFQTPNVIYGGKFWYEYGWINENLYLVSSGGEGASPQNFRYIDIETQKTRIIWPYTAGHIAISPSKEKVVLMTIPSGYLENEPDEGTYILSLDGSYSKLTDGLFVFYNGFKEDQVLGWRNDNMYSISLDGTISLIGQSKWNEHYRPLTSPDKKWILLLKNQNKIALYSTNEYEQINVWNFNERIYSVSWNPDSLGIFLSTDTLIYYLAMPNGEPVSVGDCHPNNSCGYKDFAWLP